MSRAKRVPSLLAALSVLAAALAGAVAPAAAQTTPAACIAETEPNDTAEAAPRHRPRLLRRHAAGQRPGPLHLGRDAGAGGATLDHQPRRRARHRHRPSDAGHHFGPRRHAHHRRPQAPRARRARRRTVAPTVDSNIFIPAGRYIVGVSRSTTPNGGTPPSSTTASACSPAILVPASGDTEPNDDVATAGKVHGAFAVSGDLGRVRRRVRVDAVRRGRRAGLGPERPGPGRRRRHHAALGLGRHAAGLRLRGPRRSRHRLRPAPGSRDVPRPPRLAGRRQPSLRPGGDHEHGRRYADPEPNDDVGHAVPLDPATPTVRGRLASNGDRDFYRLTIDATQAAVELDVRLIWRSGPSRTLCLEDSQGNDLQCRTGDRNAALSGLVLPAGDYIVRI